MHRKSAAAITLVMAFVLVGTATLIPVSSQPTSPWSACLLCGSRVAADAILNVLLFLPVGIGLGLQRVRLRHAVLLGALLTACVELAQVPIPGRDASPVDILTNTLGTTIGAIAVARFPLWSHPPDGAAGRLATAAGAIAAAVFLGTGWLLQPTYPDRPYYGQWTPALGHLAKYQGRVLEAEIGSVSVPSAHLSDSESVRQALGRGVPIFIRALAGPSTDRLAPVFSIFDDRGEEIVLLGMDRDVIVFRSRRRAHVWRLDAPDIRVESPATRATPGDTIRLTTWQGSGGRCLDDGSRRHCGLGFTAGVGWTLLYYVEGFPEQLRELLDALWVGAWLVPVGFWLRPRPAGLLAPAMTFLALAAPSGTGWLLATGPGEWMGYVLGLAVGLALARRVAPTQLPTGPR